jgi:hypothetical protein
VVFDLRHICVQVVEGFEVGRKLVVNARHGFFVSLDNFVFPAESQHGRKDVELGRGVVLESAFS